MDTSLPAQPGGCSQCHPGLGAKPKPVEGLEGDELNAQLNNVDCLLCHAPDYKRSVAKVAGADTPDDPTDDKFAQVPAEGVDVLVAAQNAQRPTNDMCARCHLGTGGGPNAKHGVFPTAGYDVHVDAGLTCLDCHTAEDHQIAGGADIKAQEVPEVEVTCSNCHTDGHPSTEAVEGTDLVVGEVLDTHSEYVACQTCHIPLIAPNPELPTLTYRDYSQPRLNEKTGLYGATNTMQGSLIPEYYWWNGQMERVPQPVGSRGDGMLTPWKRSTYNIVVDKADEHPIFLKLGVYFITGDVAKAVAKGVEDTQKINPDYAYSGEFAFKEETMVFSLNHSVAPADSALACAECHSAEGRLDWAALGYGEDEIALLTTFPPVQATPEPTPVPTEEATEVAQAPVEEDSPAEEAPAEDETAAATGGNTGLIIGAVVALVVVGAAAYFFTRKPS